MFGTDKYSLSSEALRLVLEKYMLRHYARPVICGECVYVLCDRKRVKCNQIPTTQKPLVFDVMIPLSRTPPTPYKINAQESFIQLCSLSR